MTALTAAEARIALLEAELEKYKMYKSGEVLIDGTDYVPWKDLPKYAENHVKALREARHELKDLHIALTELKPDTLPRVIPADELKVGQTAVMREGSAWDVGEVVPGEDGDPMPLLKVYSGTLRGHVHLVPELADTIVLLADAPEPEPEKWDRAVTDDVIRRFNENIRLAQSTLSESWRKPPFRGTPVRPQSIRAGDLYDIHTAHGSTITGVVAARNGVLNPQNGDMYRLITRKA